VKQGLWVAYGVLLLGAGWLALAVTGKLGGWANHLGRHLPPLLMLVATLAIPVLAALCSLHLQIDWKIRLALLVLLVTCVPLLTVVFNTHPVVTVVVVVVFMVEEFAIIPLINRRWTERG